MSNINKVFFLSLTWVIMFFSGMGQVKDEMQKDKTKVSATQAKIVKTQVSQWGDNVQASLQDRKGDLWFATTSNGVYRYDGKSFTNYTVKDGLNSNAVFSMLEDGNGNIWLGTGKGLIIYDGKNFRSISLSPVHNLSPEIVTSILEDQTGKLWFATYNGVYCYDGKAFTLFLNAQRVVNSNGLTLKLVTRIIEDKLGNIWFTTRTEGICRYDGNTIVNYKPDNGEWFRGLLEDKDGNIWAGTRKNGVYKYDGKTFTKILQGGKFDSFTVLSIIQDRSGNIWFGTEAGDGGQRETEGGVWRYDGKVFENVSIKYHLSHPAVWGILEDKAGYFWIGTRNTGLFRFDGKTFTSFSD